MLGIDSIRNINISDISKSENKLTYKVNEIFTAQIIKHEGDNSNISLKLSNGVEIPVHIEKPFNDLPHGLLKFQVQNNENGNLKVKIISSLVNNNTDNSDSISKAAQNLNVSDNDYPLLKDMIKNNIPLTKENVAEVKDLLSLKDKVQTDKSEKEFIENYLDYKGINNKDRKGITIILKSFFSELKDINTEELITLLGNNIELSDENIKSFIKIVNQPLTIYNDIKSMGNNEIVFDILKNNMDIIAASEVKNAMNTEISDMKNIIKNLLGDIIKPEAYTNIVASLSQNISDIKMFNSLSNQYYCLDIPLKMRDYETELKLIIKDDRKNGKKLDPKSIKLIASIKTKNLGTVDAYIKVANKNMDLQIKSDEIYVKTISSKSIELNNVLNELGYNANVTVEEKVKELDLVSSNDYFEDRINFGINAFV